MTQPAMVVGLAEVELDPALQIGPRGERKLLVTELYSATEKPASRVVWRAPKAGEKCEVQVMPDTEIAVFTERAKQERHHHKQGTEIYMVVEGSMTIQVSRERYVLSGGDMIVVNPDAVHEVLQTGTAFLCRVVTVHCGGRGDRYVDDAPVTSGT